MSLNNITKAGVALLLFAGPASAALITVSSAQAPGGPSNEGNLLGRSGLAINQNGTFSSVAGTTTNPFADLYIAGAFGGSSYGFDTSAAGFSDMPAGESILGATITISAQVRVPAGYAGGSISPQLRLISDGNNDGNVAFAGSGEFPSRVDSLNNASITDAVTASTLVSYTDGATGSGNEFVDISASLTLTEDLSLLLDSGGGELRQMQYGINIGAAQGTDVAFDIRDFNVSIETIPEPSSALLTGLASLGLLARRRR